MYNFNNERLSRIKEDAMFDPRSVSVLKSELALAKVT